MTSTTPQRIEILPEGIGDVVAQYIMSGTVAGEFTRVPGGEVYFRYARQSRRWYVNRSMSAFLEAVHIFNKCGEDVCRLFAEDADAEPEASWALVRLRSEFEKIEPLGAPETCLWSATVQDADGGLLRLFDEPVA